MLYMTIKLYSVSICLNIMQLSLTKKNESLAILHVNNKDKIKTLNGRAEPDSTYITFQVSNLCHITNNNKQEPKKRVELYITILSYYTV